MIFLATGNALLIVLLVVLLIVLVVVASSFRIVPQAHAYVIEKLGAYNATWGTGVHFLIPVLSRISKKVILKEQVVDWQPQAVITKDNVTMQIDTVIFYTITDPKAYTYGVDNPLVALDKLTATTLRNIIGDLELDETLTSRDWINTKMRDILDIATDPWGIKVNRVELKNILPPKDIRDSMEKQMRAERERRESILRAEGVKQSQILQAEGVKQSQILQAEGEKEAAILDAEGQAKAILMVQEATAKGLEMIKNVKPDQALLTLKAYDALMEMSKGQATKIIVPSDLQGLAGLTTSIKEILKD